MERNTFERFIQDAVTHDGVWLLQASDGMFAMVESSDQVSYLAVWDIEHEAKTAVADEWDEYSCVPMELKEFIHWLNEMQEDDAWIGIAPDAEGKIYPIEAAALLQLFAAEKKRRNTV